MKKISFLLLALSLSLNLYQYFNGDPQEGPIARVPAISKHIPPTCPQVPVQKKENTISLKQNPSPTEAIEEYTAKGPVKPNKKNVAEEQTTLFNDNADNLLAEYDEEILVFFQKALDLNQQDIETYNELKSDFYAMVGDLYDTSDQEGEESEEGDYYWSYQKNLAYLQLLDSHMRKFQNYLGGEDFQRYKDFLKKYNKKIAREDIQSGRPVRVIHF
ncbi:MAG: hypothetical protein HOE90_12015 [Bacteriovoracaceae bacterium]|jgi:hypothetical protein|nr:hypothetical protein [Bacteriovoracaceae bacterium]